MTEFVLATVLGLLFALGTFLVLRRDVVRVVWGVSIISQAANVYLITMGVMEGAVPVLTSEQAHHAAETTPAVTDPLVQALVLTAIVIGFGTTAFALVLTYRVYQEHGTIDLIQLGKRGETDGN
jgi:multicomponent Na+:H+ antiporter subunit C